MRLFGIAAKRCRGCCSSCQCHKPWNNYKISETWRKTRKRRSEPGDLAMPIATSCWYYAFLHYLYFRIQKHRIKSKSWLFSVFSCLPGGDLGFGPGRIQSKVCSRRFGCFQVSRCQPYEFWQAILAALPSSELVPAFLPYAVGGGAFTKLLYNME